MKPQNKDWKKFELREVCVLSKEKVQTSSLVPSCYISTENMLDNLAGIKTAKDLPSVKQVTKYSKNDILLSNIRLYLRKLWYADRDGGCSADVLVLHPQKSIDSLFLFYVLSSENFWLYASSSSKGSKMPRGEKEAIFSFPLLLPPISEQRKIAEILSACERVLTLKKELKAQKIKRKKWLLQNLLNPNFGVRLPGFTGEWENLTLGDLGTVAMNRRIFKYQTSEQGEIPFYKIGTFGSVADAYISRELFEEYKRKYPYPKIGDILISASGSIGKTVEYKGEDAYFQDSNIVWLVHDLRLDSIFLKAFYSVVRWGGLEGSTIKRLYNKDILRTPISLPPLAEQAAIAEVLSAADRELDLLEEEIQAWKRKKKALSQLLLRGIVRV